MVIHKAMYRGGEVARQLNERESGTGYGHRTVTSEFVKSVGEVPLNGQYESDMRTGLDWEH